MRGSRVWRKVLGVQHVTVDGFEYEGEGDDEVLVFAVCPTRGRRGRCSRCDRKCRGYDQGGGRRRSRALDLGTTRVFLEADAPRVTCPEHGVVVAAVPWAEPGSRFTAAFEDMCAWLTARTTATVVCALLRVTWRSVSAVVDRVVADRAGKTDMLAGLRRIGIDEIAHRRGHRYLTCIVDHDTGRLVWAAPGRNSDTLKGFFDLLGEERASQLTHVTADGAEWIHSVVRARAPKAALCLDPYHIVAWATKALDQVRRQTWNQLRSAGDHQAATAFRGSRWALVKNAEDLTGRQRTTLAGIAKTNARLYRAYLLKEQLRMVFVAKGESGRALLAGWISWARRCRIPEFVKLAKTITKFLPLITNTLLHRMSNARSEATNTHLRTLTTRAYGFHTPEALISMAMLTRGGLCPPLPGRNHP